MSTVKLYKVYSELKLTKVTSYNDELENALSYLSSQNRQINDVLERRDASISLLNQELANAKLAIDNYHNIQRQHLNEISSLKNKISNYLREKESSKFELETLRSKYNDIIDIIKS